MNDRSAPELSTAKLLGILIGQACLFTAAGVFIWIWTGRTAAEFLEPKWTDLPIGLGLAGFLILALGLVFKLNPGLKRRLVEEMGRGLFAAKQPFGPAAVVLISLSAGIGEEALFRAGLQTAASLYVPGWAAFLIATILFTLAHPGSAPLMLGVALISVVIGTVYHLTGSVLGVMIGHALYDVWAINKVQEELGRMGHWQAAPDEA